MGESKGDPLTGKAVEFASPWEDKVLFCAISGEPFNQEEMEDMLAIALDPETDTFHYRDYRKKLVVDETKTFPFNVWDAFW